MRLRTTVLCLCVLFFSAVMLAVSMKTLYPAERNAKKDIQQAVKQAADSKRRVLIVYGADWCPSCYDLEATFAVPEVRNVLDSGYVEVHVNLGQGDQNIDIVKKYKVQITGIPAFTVLDGDGALVHSQDGGSFEETDKDGVIQFLKKWSGVQK